MAINESLIETGFMLIILVFGCLARLSIAGSSSATAEIEGLQMNLLSRIGIAALCDDTLAKMASTVYTRLSCEAED